MGPIHVERQAIWLVERAEMQVLREAPFQAILGLGPAQAVKQRVQTLQRLLLYLPWGTVGVLYWNIERIYVGFGSNSHGFSWVYVDSRT